MSTVLHKKLLTKIENCFNINSDGNFQSNMVMLRKPTKDGYLITFPNNEMIRFYLINAKTKRKDVESSIPLYSESVRFLVDKCVGVTFDSNIKYWNILTEGSDSLISNIVIEV